MPGRGRRTDCYEGWRIDRIAPDGRIDRSVPLPIAQPTSCFFGGPALDRLYVTTGRLGLDADALAGQPFAGALLELDVGTVGLPVPDFAW